MINWKNLSSISDLEDADKLSFDNDVLLFKHSTTCSISHMAKMRLESSWNLSDRLIPYYLDLKTYRNVSDTISEKYHVHHESPQVIIIRKGECIYDASHLDITIEEISETLAFHA
jgi:bacillithiol system protein YtxJ